MLALIPARGGSKGVPRKNIKVLGDKPLIAYAILAAKEAKSVDRIIVSTDDSEVAEVAREYGAEVPFMRPKELASDTAVAPDVYLHAIDYIYNTEGNDVDKFMVLLPTVPFRKAQHIDEAYDLFVNSCATTLVSVKEADIPPSWYLINDQQGRVHPCNFGRAIEDTNNRQMSEVYYHNNGAIYILDSGLLRKERTYFCDNTVAYIMSSEDSIDIDTMSDFKYAQFLIDNMEIKL